MNTNTEPSRPFDLPLSFHRSPACPEPAAGSPPIGRHARRPAFGLFGWGWGSFPGSWLLLWSLAVAHLSGCGERPRPQPVPPPDARVAVPPKIGLALGGGGARGFAHIGVLRVLEQEKIPIDVVVGTSVGSLIGALYCDQGRVLDAEYLALTVEEEDLFDYRAFSLFSGGLVKGDRLEKFLRANLKHASIEAMKVPFAAVAVDLELGTTAIFRSGPVAPAVHASCSIPGVFTPTRIGDRLYVDGGVTNPVPVSVARDLGGEVVIALSIPPPIRKPPSKNPIAIAYHSISIMTAELGRLRAAEADVVVEIEAGAIDFDDFSQKKRLIEVGEEAARAALPAIRAAIDARTVWTVR